MDATHSQPRPANDTDSTLVFPFAAPSSEARARESARYAEVVKSHWTGAKYVVGRTLAQIKALILADIKAAKCLPKGARVSISIPSYSMANELRVTVKLPFVVRADEPRWEGNRWTKYTPAADLAVEDVKALARAYNYDRSDLATDYVDEEFGLRVVAVSL